MAKAEKEARHVALGVTVLGEDIIKVGYDGGEVAAIDKGEVTEAIEEVEPVASASAAIGEVRHVGGIATTIAKGRKAIVMDTDVTGRAYPACGLLAYKEAGVEGQKGLAIAGITAHKGSPASRRRAANVSVRRKGQGVKGIPFDERPMIGKLFAAPAVRGHKGHTLGDVEGRFSPVP